MTAPQWQDRPSNQVGAVTTSWCAAGEHGCIRRIRNALDNATSYELYRWLLGDSWKPLEARSTWMSGVPVTEVEAMRLIAGGAQ